MCHPVFDHPVAVPYHPCKICVGAVLHRARVDHHAKPLSPPVTQLPNFQQLCFSYFLSFLRSRKWPRVPNFQ